MVKKKGDDIDSKTKVSLFAVLGALPIIAGAITKFNTVDNKATRALRMSKTNYSLLQETHDSVTRLEAKFGTTPQAKKVIQEPSEEDD